MNKSIDAFRTISEVADDLDIPQHVLRFWETRFGSIRPLKRGGGRRYYRPDDVDLLKGIRQLLYGQGYTIKGVQRILKEDGPRFVQGVGRGDISGVPGPRDEDGPQDGTDLAAFETADGGAGASMTVRVAEPRSYAASSAADILPDAAPDRLRAVLDDLIECQRVLESLRRG